MIRPVFYQGQFEWMHTYITDSETETAQNFQPYPLLKTKIIYDWLVYSNTVADAKLTGRRRLQ
jgi:hypothetical protein